MALETMQVFKEHTGQALRQQCRVWPDSLWIGIPANQQGSRINGQALTAGEVMCRPGGQDFELVTPGAFDIYGLVIQLPALSAAAERQGISLDTHWHFMPRRKVAHETLYAVSFLIERLLASQTLAIASHIHQDILLMALLELLQVEQPNVVLPLATPIARKWSIASNATWMNIWTDP
ncbi:hypothetical protein HSBAA_08470 [Vreelandella sulfidaeris]|uniref:AraC-type transcription regulator ligand-binding domain-containing protein n=1 Tax=Vreelandella sulfidaeris TaxID=115553 RepID=A0A455U4W9_9GAMM|nr:hypothetical protein HSBAA_08470 [Halomonas sulfidaeris]